MLACNISCTRWFVCVIQQGVCAWSTFWLWLEKKTGWSSPGWASRLSKDTLLRSTLGGVPVFRRPISNPTARIESASWIEARSPERPALNFWLPTWHKPLRKVPVVRMIEVQETFLPEDRCEFCINKISRNPTKKLGRTDSITAQFQRLYRKPSPSQLKNKI